LEDQVLDRELVSAAHTLDYTVYEMAERSEWRLVTHLVRANPFIKSLRLRGERTWEPSVAGVIPNDTPPVSQLALEPDARLPPLEELGLTGPYSTYMWDREYCLLFSQCMNWMNMRKLDVGTEYPLHLFSALVGRVPNLKSLRFGLPDDVEKPTAAVELLESTSLIELDIDNIHTHMDTLWPAIRTQKKSLEMLILRPSQRGPSSYHYSPPSFLDIKYIEEIAEKFTAISRLGWSLPFQGDDLWDPNKTYTEVCSFP
jgi:hypothetical protein